MNHNHQRDYEEQTIRDDSITLEYWVIPFVTSINFSRDRIRVSPNSIFPYPAIGNAEIPIHVSWVNLHFPQCMEYNT